MLRPNAGHYYTERMSLLPNWQLIGRKQSIFPVLKDNGLPVPVALACNLSVMLRHCSFNKSICSKTRAGSRTWDKCVNGHPEIWRLLFCSSLWPALESTGVSVIHDDRRTRDSVTIKSWHFPVLFLYKWFNEQTCNNLHIFLGFLPSWWSCNRG